MYDYNPNQPAEFDGERFVSLTSGPRRVVRIQRPVNYGALAAVDKALRDLASPLPPVTRWFKAMRWLRAKRAATGVWYRWRLDRFRSFRFGLGCTIGSWIAGEDLR